MGIEARHDISGPDLFSRGESHARDATVVDQQALYLGTVSIVTLAARARSANAAINAPPPVCSRRRSPNTPAPRRHGDAGN